MLYAICVCVDNGWPFDQEILKKNNIKIGDKFEVEDVSMGQFNTSITLKGFKNVFNSVHFRFEDESGSEVNIYRDHRYNPYLCPVRYLK